MDTMRQANGTELLGMNDPRGASIGIIYVSPNDDRKGVLAAILTQEKLSRKDIVIVFSETNNAFQNARDFDYLKSMVDNKVQEKIIFVATGASAEFAHQRQFPVFPTLESYTESLNKNDVSNQQEQDEAPAEKRFSLFGAKRSKSRSEGSGVAGGLIAGAAAGAALSGAEQHSRQANADSVQSVRSVSPGDQNAGQALQQSSVASAESTNTIDDDDAIDNTPSLSVRHGAAGGIAGASLLADQTLKRGQANPDLDAAGPTPLKRAPAASNMSAAPVSEAATTSAVPTAGETARGGEDSKDSGVPGIIELGPGRNRGRRTVNLPESAAAGPVPAPQPSEVSSAPASRGATRRRNGGVATAAGLASGLALGAAAANASPAGAPTSASAGTNAATGSVRSAGGGQPPQRLAPPNRNGRNGGPPPSRRRVLLLLLLLLLLTALVSGIVYASINPASFQTTIVRPFSNLVPPGLQSNPVSINIVPDSKEVQDSYVMQAVANQPNAAQLQVGMRNLAATPDAQTKTVAGTGHTQTQPTAAKGKLTFLNGSFATFTVGAGTIISARNGVSVVTDLPAVIPAGVPGGANGSISVPAHAVTAGTVGNLDQGSINRGCCSAENFIFVRNDTAFTGGVDPQNYTFVQQGDVNAAATPLESTLAQQASVQFKQQVKGNERVVGDPVCNSNVQVDPTTVGDKGRNITETTIIVTAKCTGVAYDQAGAQAIAKDRLQKKANSNPGQGYALVGTIATDVSISKVNADSISLLVNARGIWVYQWDDAQKQALARQIAGKKVSDAQALLNAQHGINNAKIEAKGDTLPTDPNQIMLNVQKVPGENVNNNNGGSNNANPNGAPASESGKGLVPSDSVKG
ncbi:MAG: hypothetical protein NVSMB44_07680 [Ktedonobacteraceae bacterium]